MGFEIRDLSLNRAISSCSAFICGKSVLRIVR
jgi:hypothetical protein